MLDTAAVVFHKTVPALPQIDSNSHSRQPLPMANPLSRGNTAFALLDRMLFKDDNQSGLELYNLPRKCHPLPT
jgi:hypothetical protein